MSDQTKTIAERFAAIFQGRQDAFYQSIITGEADATGKIPMRAETIRRPLTIDDWEAHLRGDRDKGLVIVPIVPPNNVCWFGAIDADLKSLDKVGLTVQDILVRLEKQGWMLWPFFSKSEALHLYWFTPDAPLPAAQIRAALKDARAKLGLPADTEIFPKQTSLDPGDIGSAINIPFYGDTRLPLSDNSATLSDWVLRVEDFKARAATKTTTLGPDDVGPFESYGASETEWAVHGFIAMGATEIVAGESGHFKSGLYTDIAQKVAHGQDWCGMKTTKRKVLILDAGDNPKSVMAKRLRMLGINQTDDPDRIIIWGSWVEQMPTICQKVTDWIQAQDPKPLVLVDCLGAFFTGDSENDNAQMRKFMQLFDPWKALGAAVSVLHNRGKNGLPYRGATAMKDACDVLRTIEATFAEDTNSVTGITIETHKNRLQEDYSPPRVFALEFKEKPEPRFIRLDSLPPSAELKTQKADFYEILASHPSSNSEQLVKLCKGAKISRDRVRQLLNEGLRDGLILQRGTKGMKVIYHLVEQIQVPF